VPFSCALGGAWFIIMNTSLVTQMLHPLNQKTQPKDAYLFIKDAHAGIFMVNFYKKQGFVRLKSEHGRSKLIY